MTKVYQVINVENLTFSNALHMALSHSMHMHEAIDLGAIGLPYEGKWLVTQMAICGNPFSLQFQALETDGKDLVWESE